MATSNCEVFLHLIWTTYGRQPDLHPSVKTHVLECIEHECRDLKANVLALNAVDDHVHLLVRVGRALSSSMIAKQAKGVSSRLMNTALRRPGFRWQEGYGAYSVSRWDVSKIRGYIERQEEHHADGTTKSMLEPD